MIQLRKTNYSHCPAQTHGGGTHEFRVGLGGLFDQGCDLAIADALANVVLGSESDPARLDALVRKFELDVTRLVTLKRLQALLPSDLSLDLGDLSASARALHDLASDDGPWASHFDSAAPPLVDQHVAETKTRLAQFKHQAVRKFGFAPAIMALRQLLVVCQTAIKKEDEEDWQPKYSESLKRSARTLENYATILKQRSWWKRLFRRGLGRATVDDLKRQHEADRRLAERRRSQLKNRVKRMILAQLTDPLSSMIEELEHQSDRLFDLEQTLRDGIKPLDDGITVTHLVQRVTDILYDDVTCYMLLSGVFAATGCGREEISAQLREGIPLAGRVFTPESLALLETAQAKRALANFKHSFFTKAIPSALRIDLTNEAFQLKLASMLPDVCAKARPHLRLHDVGGVDQIHETYVHAHPSVRSVLEEYRSGNVQFANAADDQDFAIPERHVIVVTSAMVGPGHARPEYLKGLYARARMMRERTFEPIHPCHQSFARPLEIPHRPVEKDDSVHLFELAAAQNLLVNQKHDGADVYLCVPMDDTIRYHFRETTVTNRRESADHFVALLTEDCFIDFVSAYVGNLPADWYIELVERLDADIADNIVITMVSLGILHRIDDKFQFAVPYDASMPYHHELFETRTHRGVGLTKSRFIDALHQEDDLYTRVLVDVVLSEAAGKINYRLLTPFAKTMVDELRGQF